VESFSHEEEGTCGHDDWPGLVSVLERELALLQRIAEEKNAPSAELTARAEALNQRYTTLSARISEAQTKAKEEFVQLGESKRRLKDVHQAYTKR
jgi:hypothetical protein